MARNLTVALAPDDFKPVKDLEPQVTVQPKGVQEHIVQNMNGM